MTERFAIDRLRLDGGCQPRAVKLLDVIEDYAAAMVMGAEFPPVVVFYDGAEHWLADGYHRRDAAVAAGRTEILADIRQGTRRDAILFSVGANAAHGLRRTNEDKRRSVMTLLADQEWSGWSDREIARQCAVSPDFANRLRPKDTVIEGQYQTRTFVHPKTGAPTTMNTSRIGGSNVERPVFDNSRFAEGQPGSSAEDEPPVPAVDMSMSHLWRALRDVVETIKSLPTPTETVDRFPRDLEHALRAEDVAATSEWLAEFAELWATGQRDRDERTAALVQRARELRGHVAAD